MHFQLFSAECPRISGRSSTFMLNLSATLFCGRHTARGLALVSTEQRAAAETECVHVTPRAVIQQRAGKLKQDESRRAAGVKISGRHEM